MSQPDPVILRFAPAPLFPQPVAGVTVRQLIRRFLRDKKRARIGSRLLERYLHYCLSFARRYGRRAANTIRARHIVRWIMSHEEWAENSTREDAARAVCAAWKWAADVEELPDIRPIAGLQKQKQWGAPQSRAAIRPDEYESMMRHAKDCTGGKGSRGAGQRRGRPSRSVFRRALFFLAQTGARTCEMRVARWSDVDWERGIVQLDEHKTAGKTGRPRMIALSRRLLWLLRWMHRRRQLPQTGRRAAHAELIFASTWGTPWTAGTFAKLFRRYARLAGVREEVSAYSLRHGFCVAGLKRGAGAKQLADVMGHTTTRYVDHYGKAAGIDTDYLHATVDQVHGR